MATITGTGYAKADVVVGDIDFTSGAVNSPLKGRSSSSRY